MKKALLLLAACFLMTTAQAQGIAAITSEGTEPCEAYTPAVTASPPVGTWHGALAIPGKALPFVLAITQSGTQLAVVLQAPGSQLNGHALQLQQHQDTLRIYDALSEARFEYMRSADVLLLVGQWQQRGFREALVLRRTAAVPAGTPAASRQGAMASSGRQPSSSF